MFPFGTEDLLSRAIAQERAAKAQRHVPSMGRAAPPVPFRSALANALAHWALHLDRRASERVLATHSS
jgi:hypothetical protein